MTKSPSDATRERILNTDTFEYWIGQYKTLTERQCRTYADKTYPLLCNDAISERQQWWKALEDSHGKAFITALLDSLA